MVAALHSGWNRLLARAAEHKGLSVIVTVLLVLVIATLDFAEQGVAGLLHPQHALPTVRIQFRDQFNLTPAIHVYVNGEEAPMQPDGSVEVLRSAMPKIKVFYLDTSKLAMLTSERSERGTVLRPRLEGLAALTITVTRE